MGVVWGGENGRKMWKRRVYKVGGKYYAQHSVLNRGTIGMTHTNPFARLDRGTKEESQARKLSHLEIQDQRKVSHQVILKNQEFDTGNNDEQPNVEAASRHNWFKQPKKPPTPNLDWKMRQHDDSWPP
uniref:Uncharacterized protein n=1 Tax=Tanacetum cinerariifolium TaxID=118510 RepID=A0A699ICH4_TANCI|nr:hypothetical protein [Tanacetum cinerariifolium]